MRDGDRWYADNTDGAGIVRDLTDNLGVALAGRDVLMLGAGGAAHGIMVPLLGEAAALASSSPTAPCEKAEALVRASRRADALVAASRPRRSPAGSSTS